MIRGEPCVCAYAKLLSPEMGLAGTSFKDCGCPCEKTQIALRDSREGKEHPVLVDVGCRNTVFSAEANSVADDVPKFVEKGVRRFRGELLREDAKQAEALIRGYVEVAQGKKSGSEVRTSVGAVRRLGVLRVVSLMTSRLLPMLLALVGACASAPTGPTEHDLIEHHLGFRDVAPLATFTAVTPRGTNAEYRVRLTPDSKGLWVDVPVVVVMLDASATDGLNVDLRTKTRATLAAVWSGGGGGDYNGCLHRACGTVSFFFGDQVTEREVDSVRVTACGETRLFTVARGSARHP